MTRTERLREIAKFAAGLVTGDLLAGLWFLAAGSLPQTFFGMLITVQITWLWVGFDFFVVVALVHYAWNPKFAAKHGKSHR